MSDFVPPDQQTQYRKPIDRKSWLRALSEAAAWFGLGRKSKQQQNNSQFGIFTPAQPWPGVVPDNVPKLAMDDFGSIQFANSYGTVGEGLGFIGYSVLAELAQRPEFRRFAEIFAEEMTRKFVRLVSASDEPQSMRIKLLMDAFETLKLKETFRKIAEVDSLYGRANLYPDIGRISDEEKQTPLIISKETIPLGSLRGFKVIEPFWTYPAQYDLRDPTADDFYKPNKWYVMGTTYHASRMMPFVGRPVPDILKPAYSFGGMSTTQMVKPYVDNWIRTRQNVSELIETFSQQVLSTEMDAVLSGGGAEGLDNRARLYLGAKSNRGLMIIDKEREDLKVVTSPLTELAALQAQAQEQMCSVAAVPLVKFLGITPSGLNASSDGEIRVFFDTVMAQQIRLYEPHMRFIIELIMQSVLGEVHTDISHQWEALWQMSEIELANVRSTNANTAKTYIDASVLDPQEERERLATEEDGLYQGLDPDDMPQPPMDMSGGIDPETGMPINLNDNNLDPSQNDFQPKDSQDDAPDDVTKRLKAANDKEIDFKESEHPRDHGKFSTKPGVASGVVARTTAKSPQRRTAGRARRPARQSGPSKTEPASSGPESSPPGRQLSATIVKDGQRLLTDGSLLPEHIANLKIPPAWTDVAISSDPDAPLQVKGKDAKGRVQSIYNKSFSETNAAAKFQRVNQLAEQFDQILQRNIAAQQSNDQKKKDAAECLDLIMRMGVRPGGEGDTGADKKAYGATTLLGKHIVTFQNGKTFLRFTGKKGVQLNLPVTDADLAKRLQQRAAQAGRDGQIFPNINEKTLLDHVKEVSGSTEFKTKDFRTHLGTKIASEVIAKIAAPTPDDMKAWKKAVKQVAIAVSEKLGNTPTIALQSYINPTVFSLWGSPPKNG